MAIPNPEPGLVISYAHPWHHEHKAGREEGHKDKPSVIVLAVARDTDGVTIVTASRDESRLGIRPARRRSDRAQQLGDGVDETLGCFNGTGGIVWGDRAC